jgi:methyl-accepting chemotaxis protein WspA
MKDWSLQKQIVTSFTVILLLMVAMAAFIHIRLADIEQESVSLRDDSVGGLYYGQQLEIRLLTHQLLAQKLLLGAPAKHVDLSKELESSRTTLLQGSAQYSKTIFQEQDRKNFEALKAEMGPYLQTLATLTAPANKQHAPDPALLAQLERQFERTRAAFKAVNDTNNASAFASIEHIMHSLNASRLGLLASFAVFFLLAVAGLFLLLKALAGQLGQLTRSVTDSAGEIATTARQQQATASEIAATTTEIGATSKEISATSKELLKTMGQVSESAEQTALLASNGQAGLAHMEETMRRVMEAAGSINAKLAVLNEKAGNINQVVTTITKVADQTNLLSLNAAIEAEKAGDYGRGFAVVATEIRRLADQTAVATYDIEQMVKEIQSAVAAGVMGMDKFSEEVRRGMHEVQEVGTQLSQIIDEVQALAPRFDLVNDGMQAQTAGAEQISDALAQLSEAARQTVESLHQSSQAIDELNAVADTLRGSVSNIRLGFR